MVAFFIAIRWIQLSTPLVMLFIVSLILLFFFSSRRRHTRLQGDWSSDVCSSDLEAQPHQVAADAARRIDRRLRPRPQHAAKPVEVHRVSARTIGAEFEEADEAAPDRKSVV